MTMLLKTIFTTLLLGTSVTANSAELINSVSFWTMLTGQSSSITYTQSVEKSVKEQWSYDEHAPKFTFINHQQVTLDILVTGLDRQPLDNLMLTVSMINRDVVESSDPRLKDKMLLTHFKTDLQGRITVTIDLPKTVEKVLLELGELESDNNVIAYINDDLVIGHHFEQID